MLFIAIFSCSKKKGDAHMANSFTWVEEKMMKGDKMDKSHFNLSGKVKSLYFPDKLDQYKSGDYAFNFFRLEDGNNKKSDNVEIFMEDDGSDHERYEFNRNGYLIRYVQEGKVGNTKEWYFDGDKLEEVRMSSKGILIGKRTFDYDESNTLVGISNIKDDDSSRCDFHYSKNFVIFLTHKSRDSIATRFEFDKYGNRVFFNKNSVYSFNNDSVLISEIFQDGTKIENHFNDDGLILWKVEYDTLCHPMKWVAFSYSNSNKLVEKTTTTESSVIIEKWDKMNNLIEYLHVDGADSEKSSISHWEEYDEFNNIIWRRIIRIDNVGTSWERNTEFTYKFDKCHNWVERTTIEEDSIVSRVKRIIEYYE